MWKQISSNKRKTVFFSIIMLLVFVLFMAVVGLYLFNDIFFGVILGVVVWIVTCLITYFQGDKMFLASAGAKKIKKDDFPVLYNVVEEMAIAAGLKKIPDIYIVDEDAPNAFATGRSPETASVAVTRGLIVRLNRQELQGVIAHEIAHIANSDILVMLFTGTILGTIVLISDILCRSRFNSRSSSGNGGAILLVLLLLAVILGPICAQLIYLAISRKREYLADACAAQFTRYPMGLANALMKISNNTVKMETANNVTAAMYIVNPLKFDKVTKRLSDLSSTHPSTQDRIKILTSMANVDFASYEQAYKDVTHKNSSPVTSNMANNVAWTLPLAAAISTEMPVEETPEVKIEKHRKTEDVLWKKHDYIFIQCDCGTKLKIPPDYLGRQIKCPHCKKYHTAQ